MKTPLIFLFILCVSLSSAQQNQTSWESELDFGNGAVFSTFLNIKETQNQYTITSPKNADVRIIGGLKARLGRLLGKTPKKGVLLRINATQKGDSLFGNTKMPVFGELEFRGLLTENLLSGEFRKNDTIIMGTLKGVKSSKNSIDYSYLYPKILKITNDNIYFKEVLQTKKWKKFQKQLKNLCYNAQEDIELFLGFNILSSNLPFSHYNLFIEEEGVEEKKEANELKEATIVFEEKNSNTAYLKIKNFSSSQKELSDVLPKIVEKNYQNLIIDLRDNGGGGIEAAFELAKYIENKQNEVGYFITNKLKYSGFQPELFKTLPDVEVQATQEFISSLKAGKGAKLVFKKSNNPVFSGNLYVLTNSKTASTCEPIIYTLKESGRAIIIGEKTAGAMLAGSFFNISGKYLIVVPIADFYTYDGVRLEGVGVTPTIETNSDNALIKALELINK